MPSWTATDPPDAATTPARDSVAARARRLLEGLFARREREHEQQERQEREQRA